MGINQYVIKSDTSIKYRIKYKNNTHLLQNMPNFAKNEMSEVTGNSGNIFLFYYIAFTP